MMRNDATNTNDAAPEKKKSKTPALIWRNAMKADEHGDHRRLRAYLAARGLDVEKWPGSRVPSSLRYDAKCLDVYVGNNVWEMSPAMVARCRTPLDPPHEVTLVHRTFLDPTGKPKKREVFEGDGEGRAARMHKGDRNGHAIWLYEPDAAEPPLERFPGGVLIAGEGIETSGSCLQATGRCTLSALDIHGLRTLVLDPAIFEPMNGDGTPKADGEWVHTFILAADLDRSGSGQVQTPEARDRLADLHPRATFLVRFPTPAVAPTLVEAAGSGERYPCVRCGGQGRLRPSDPRTTCPKCGGSGDLGFWGGQHRPVMVDGAVGKSVDWNDVLVAAGEAAVRDGLMAGVDLDRNKARALAWSAAAPTVSDAGGGEISTAANSDPAHASGTRDARRDNGGRGIGGGKGSGRATARGWVFGDGGAEPPRNLKGLVSYVEGFDEPVLSQSPLLRAWAYLLMECAPPAGSRRFTLAYWGGAFYHFDGWGGAWVRLPDTAIEGMVQRWLQKFRYEKPDGDVPLVNPTNRAVHEVLKSLAAEVLVDVSKVPTWLPDSLAEDGTPIFGQACRVWETRRRREELEQRFGPAEGWIVFPNGRLSLRALLDRRVLLERNTPTLFTPAARPYPLPEADLRQAIESGFTDDLFTRLCPMFRLGLRDWCGQDADGGVQRTRQLQLMFGDTMSPNRTLEKIFVVTGPRRSGKGCIQEALKAACGEDAVATPSFFDLGDRFGLVPFLGKSLAIFSDAHMGHMTDGARVTEILKVISGGDAVTVRDMHTAPQTNVKLGCRFWIFVNDMPRLSDNSGALAGRLVVWPMLRSFFDVEEESIKRGIMREGAGIAVWALCGYVELFSMRRPSIEMGAIARTISDEFAGSSSVVISFLRDCVVCREAAGRTEVEYRAEYTEDFSAVYQVYKRHCERQGNNPVANNRFVSQLRPHVPLIDVKQVGTGTRGRVLVGLRLRDDLDAELTRAEPVNAHGQRLVSYARPGDVTPEAQLTFDQRFPT